MRLASSLNLRLQIEILLMCLKLPNFWILIQKMCYKNCGLKIRREKRLTEFLKHGIYSDQLFLVLGILILFSFYSFQSSNNGIEFGQNSYFEGDLNLPNPILILW